jgi:hypothetical protein
VADITDLLDLTGQVRAPALAELEQVAGRRRRRAVAVRTLGAAVAVAVLLAVQPLGRRDAAPAPIAPTPTPSESRTPDRTPSEPPPDSIQGPFPTLTPYEIRHHPDAVRLDEHVPVTAAPGVAVRQWEVCLADCSRATQHQYGELQRALEVTHDGFRSSTLHAGDPSGSTSHVVDEWFLHRGELVDGRGRIRDVRVGASTPVTEIGGPVVYATGGGVAWVDLDTMLLHEVEGTYWDWWGAADTWYWGNIYRVPDTEVLEQGVVWQNMDGSYGVHMLRFDVTDASTQMLRSGIPGTMGVIEPGPTRYLHVSTDHGATWEVRVLPASWGSGYDVPSDWRSWTEDWPSWETP